MIGVLSLLIWGGGTFLCIANSFNVPLIVSLFIPLGMFLMSNAIFLMVSNSVANIGIRFAVGLLGWAMLLGVFLSSPTHDTTDLHMFVSGSILIMISVAIEIFAE